MSKKEKNRFEICEMFCAKADRDRVYFGIIKRFEDHLGNPQVFSKICMPDDGYIVAKASDQKTLGTMLDEITVMFLDKNLHADAGVKTKIFDADFFLN